MESYPSATLIQHMPGLASHLCAIPHGSRQHAHMCTDNALAGSPRTAVAEAVAVPQPLAVPVVRTVTWAEATAVAVALAVAVAAACAAACTFPARIGRRTVGPFLVRCAGHPCRGLHSLLWLRCLRSAACKARHATCQSAHQPGVLHAPGAARRTSIAHVGSGL